MKAVRILLSLAAVFAGLGLFGYTIFLIIETKSSYLFICFPFLIIGITSLAIGFGSIAKNPKFGNLLLTSFIALLVAEIFNMLLCLIDVGIIPIHFLPSIDYHYINKGPSTTSYILGLCVVGIVVSSIAKKGKFVPSIIAAVVLMITEGLIVGLNTWFVMRFGPTYIILFAITIITYINIFIFKKGAQRAQEIIKEVTKKEAPDSQNLVSTTTEAPKSKVRVWVENGFTYSNRP